MRTTGHGLCSLLLLGSMASLSVFAGVVSSAGGGAKTPGKPVRAIGVLLGKVTAGPKSPVGGIGRSSEPLPLPGVRLVILAMDGRQIASALTDEKGDYNIKLPAGTYRVQMPSRPNSPGRGAENLPATVTITGGKETRLDVSVDTGIR